MADAEQIAGKPVDEWLAQPDQEIPFGDAVAALKGGLRIFRHGWNGKGMWLFLVHAGEWAMQHQMTPKEDLRPWIVMKTADGSFVPWVASQSDVLAEDWAILEFSNEWLKGEGAEPDSPAPESEQKESA